ncbi:unnamed protein product [Chironomus riparius]|uniref:Uncharacterized protein n=1 Tax=Chironomus riparius TaxID=315576 RepID=A0A9N9RW50_9DIPT|nr:unnamed protein product [Chironomus riparius]
MTFQAEAQSINDSTVQKLMTIVENHNRNYRDEEIMALREEISKIQNEIKTIEELYKVKENLNQKLTSSFLEIRLHCKIHVETTEHQVRRMKHPAGEIAAQLHQTKVFFRHASEQWKKKEHRYIRDIEKMNNYIHGMHSTLERNGIFGGQQIEGSDEYESEVESSGSPYRSNHYDSDPQYDGDCDDYDESFQEAAQDQQNIESSLQDNRNYESIRDADEAVEIDCVTSNVQCSGLVQASQRSEEPVESFAEPMASDKLISSDILAQDKASQEPNWCDIIEAEDSGFNQQSSSIELVHFDSSASDSTCYNVVVKCQEASSTSNSQTGDKEFEADKPIEPEVPMKINMDPFVHGYVEKKCEESKLKSKPKKQRKQKPKSKPKFKNLVAFGGF